MTDQRADIAFYDCQVDAESLSHTTVDDAVEHRLDALDVEHWPDVLTVHAYARDVVDERARQWCAELAAERLFDDLEEYFDPDSDETPPHAIDAARVFVDTVLATQIVWSCSEVPDAAVEVNVAEWIREHKRHWVDKADIAEWLSAREQLEAAHV